MRVHESVHGEGAKFAEGRRVHICRRENYFVQVLPSAQIVVVIGDDVDRGTAGWIYSQNSRRARLTARSVAHNHIELCSAVRRYSCWSRVTRRRRASDVCAVLLPLIAERRSASCRDAECRRLSHSHRLIRRLCRDGRSHCSCIHRQRSHRTCFISSRVAHNNIEFGSVVCRCRSWSRIAGRGRAHDVRAVFLPLVAERSRPCRGHVESRRLPHGHRLIRWLRRDCRRDRCRVHRQGGYRAGDTPC